MPTNPALGNEELELATGIATAAVAIGQAVKRDVATGANYYTPCSVSGERYDGVAYTAADAGKSFTVVLPRRGTVFGKCLAGAAMNANVNAMTNASGKFILATTALHIAGVTLQAASGADVWVAIALEDGDRVV